MLKPKTLTTFRHRYWNNYSQTFLVMICAAAMHWKVDIHYPGIELALARVDRGGGDRVVRRKIQMLLASTSISCTSGWRRAAERWKWKDYRELAAEVGTTWQAGRHGDLSTKLWSTNRPSSDSLDRDSLADPLLTRPFMLKRAVVVGYKLLTGKDKHRTNVDNVDRWNRDRAIRLQVALSGPSRNAGIPGNLETALNHRSPGPLHWYGEKYKLWQ